MPLYARALGLHAGDHRPRNVRHEPVAHLRVDDLVGGVRAHSAGIRALVVIEGALVVLGRDQRHYALTVAHHQERQLFALQAFFQNNSTAGLAQELAASISSAIFCASSFDCATTTPLPAAKPSAFTTTGV